jgi:hypothetical protein
LRLVHLAHQNGIVEDEVEKLVKTLELIAVSYSNPKWRVWTMGVKLTLILPSIRTESCSYSQTLTVACCFEWSAACRKMEVQRDDVLFGEV